MPNDDIARRHRRRRGKEIIDDFDRWFDITLRRLTLDQAIRDIKERRKFRTLLDLSESAGEVRVPKSARITWTLEPDALPGGWVVKRSESFVYYSPEKE